MESLTLEPDPYKLLGVSKDAQLPEIRSAHRKLVLKCHPDKVQDAALKAIKQEEFQKVQHAYELLSDETRRVQYDDQVKLFELRKEMGRGNPTPRSNPFEYEIRTAEPRPSSYGRPTPIPKVYTTYQVPKSHEDFFVHEEPIRHTPKKSSSYDSSDRKRREAEERTRDEEERHRQREKESKRSAHSKKEKSRDKERKRGQEEKVRSRGPGAYVEDDSDQDDYRPPPPRSSEKKSNNRRMEEEIRMREEAARAERERATAEVPRIREIPLGGNWDVYKEKAAKYMQASRNKATGGDDFVSPGLRRAETSAPTTATYNVRYATPPAQYSDDEAPRRSSARPKVETRRSSDTPKREKPSRRSPAVDPYVVSPPSPPPTRRPSLHTYSSAPPTAEEFVRTKPVPSRSKTQDYPRHEIPPTLPRASTFQSGDRGRDRGATSKLRKEVTSDSESDAPIHASPRRSHSPPPRRTHHRYVYENGATIPVPPSSRHRADLHDLNDSYPRERSESPHGTAGRPPLTRNLGSGGIPTRSYSGPYYTASPEPQIHNVRPTMSPRTDSHRGSSRQVPQFFNDVKYTKGFDNVSYSANPADMYASHHRRGSDDRGYHYPRSREPIYT